MSKKAKIYTRTGDQGETGLVGGQRLAKSDELIDLYGTCDELNSFIGVLVSEISEQKELIESHEFLQKVQSRLFDLGSLLACQKEERENFSLPHLDEVSVKELESEIDLIDEQLAPMTHFILPGGTRASAQGQVCRTVCRRFERKLVARERKEKDVPPYAISYINRLSDYLFSLARLINKLNNCEEIPWRPKKGS